MLLRHHITPKRYLCIVSQFHPQKHFGKQINATHIRGLSENNVLYPVCASFLEIPTLNVCGMILCCRPLLYYFECELWKIRERGVD